MRTTALALLAVCLVLAALAMPAAAQYQILDSYYRYDIPFPQFTDYWKQMGTREQELNLRIWEKPLAGSLHVYVLNTGSTPLEITDVLLAQISLKRAIALSDQNVRREADPSSIYFSDLSAAEREKLIAAGDPIWWRVQPQVAKPGEVCEVAVRFRTNPPGQVKLSLARANQNKPIDVTIGLQKRPRFEQIIFAPKLDRIYAYCTAAPGAPTRILLDGRDITSSCRIASDPAVSLVPIIADLKTPLKAGSYCCLQAEYPGGVRTSDLIKVWSDEPAYGVWGGMPGEAGDVATAKKYYDDLALHNMNCQMEQIGSACVNSFLESDEGRSYIASKGIRRTVNDFGKQGTKDPYLYFLVDEPDAADMFVEGVPPLQRCGALIQDLIAKTQRFNREDPETPSAANVDTTFKPMQYYIYGQLGDIYMTDPYYQPRISGVLQSAPSMYPLFATAKFMYASSAVPMSACAPHPLHMVIYAVNGHSSTGEDKFRFPTAEEKRLELYYCLGAGAKQFSYWWYTPVPEGKRGANGCGSQQPAGKALFTGIGLLGAEFRTADELIANGCPADVKVKAPELLWTKTLLSGQDTMILVCVNEDHACDRLGIVYKPIEKADLSVTLPKWLDAKDIFEVTYKGTQDVRWNRAGQEASLNLGTTPLTRMIVITSNPALRTTLQKRYGSLFAANVAKLLADQPAVAPKSADPD